MNGMATFEEIVRNPYLKVIDWEYLLTHPEAKLAVWQRYQNDSWFHDKIEDLKNKDVTFKNRFNNYFNSYNRSR